MNGTIQEKLEMNNIPKFNLAFDNGKTQIFNKNKTSLIEDLKTNLEDKALVELLEDMYEPETMVLCGTVTYIRKDKIRAEVLGYNAQGDLVKISITGNDNPGTGWKDGYPEVTFGESINGYLKALEHEIDKKDDQGDTYQEVRIRLPGIPDEIDDDVISFDEGIRRTAFFRNRHRESYIASIPCYLYEVFYTNLGVRYKAICTSSERSFHPSILKDIDVNNHLDTSTLIGRTHSTVTDSYRAILISEELGTEEELEKRMPDEIPEEEILEGIKQMDSDTYGARHLEEADLEKADPNFPPPAFSFPQKDYKKKVFKRELKSVHKVKLSK